MGRIAGVFPIGETGEQFVVAEWVPDPEVIAQEFFRLASELEDWAEPLAKARAAFIYSTEQHFIHEEDPSGKKWEFLNSTYENSTKKKNSAHPNEILQLTGDLKEKATAESGWFVGEREIFFRTDTLPFYGPYHQAGTKHGEKAKVYGSALDKVLNNESHKLTTAELASLEKGGQGLNLPQRMFIGADDITILEIEEIFVDFIKNRTTRIIGGGERAMGSNVRGTLPIIGFLPSGQPRLSSGQFGRKTP